MSRSIDKKRLELIVAAALVVAFLFVLAGTVTRIRARKIAERSGAVSAELARQQVGVLYERKREPAGKDVKKLEWKRDPFTPEDAGPVSLTTTLRITGISAGDGKKKPKAIINNEIVSIGSKIGPYTVIEISRERVVITDGKENKTLTME